jgi:hypothetical protein
VNARQKNVLSLLVTVSVALALGLYAFHGEQEPGSTKKAESSPPPALFDARAPDSGTPASDAAPRLVITWLSLDVPQGKTELQRQGDSWRITSPRPGPANKQLVNTLARDIAEAKFKETLEQQPTDADLERYGLKTPRATVSARAYVPDSQGGGADDPARQRTLTFRVGADNSFDGSLYVQREGDPRVYLAHGALRLVLFKNTDGWRDSHIFVANEPSLLRIVVKARKNSYTLERLTPQQPWEMAKPVKMVADRQRVEKMMTALRTYQVQGFPDAQREPLVRKALEKPQVELTFVPTRGEAMRVRLTELEINGHPLTFALSEGAGEPLLAQVDSATLNVLDLSPADFKSRRVLDIPGGTVGQIILRPAGRGDPLRLEMSLDSNRWELTSPLPARARQFTVASLLSSLQKLEAVAVVEAQPKNWARYGIGETSAGVSLMDTSGTLLARLWLGAPVPGKPERVYARGTSDDALEVDKATLDALPLTLDALLEQSPAASGRP